ncbi:hypothetical protein VCNHCC008D_002283A, partial [Vibrio cholerae O1 str. NHCC-008D]
MSIDDGFFTNIGKFVNTT